MTQPLAKETIEELKKDGFSVGMVQDQDGLYAWAHRAGAGSEKHHYRRSEAQAWRDCYNYANCMPEQTVSWDWVDGPPPGP